MASTKRKKRNKPKGYDSTLEYNLHIGPFKHFTYHPDRIKYNVPASYEPDFSFNKSGKTYFIEVKGRFRTRQEASKYIHVRSSLKESEELIFVFSDAAKPMPGAQKRKNGTKQTHGEWARLNEFRYCCNNKEDVTKWIARLM